MKKKLSVLTLSALLLLTACTEKENPSTSSKTNPPSGQTSISSVSPTSRSSSSEESTGSSEGNNSSTLIEYCSVTLHNGTGYTLSGPEKVEKGEDVTITITLEEGYVKGSGFKLLANQVEIPVNERGEYVISNVQADLNVMVEGVEKETFSVLFATSDVYTLNGETSVEYGADYTFSIAYEQGYGLTKDSKVVVREGETEKEVTQEGDVYKVKAVKGNLHISVEGVAKVTCFITFDEVEGVAFHGKTSAATGSDYSFSFTLEEGYTKGDEFKVTANGQVLTAKDDDTYQIAAIHEDVVISIEGVEEKKIDVTFRCNIDNAIKNAPDQILYRAEKYTFRLSWETGYDQSESVCQVRYQTASGVEDDASKNEDGTYSIVNPHENFVILVTGCVINTYKATFKAGESELASYDVVYNTKVSEDNVADAEAKAKEAAPEGKAFVYWDKDFDKLTSNTIYTAVYADLITEETQLFSMEENGKYVLGKDFDVSETLYTRGNGRHILVSDFAGYLDGAGHTISSGYEYWGDDTQGGAFLFTNFSGTIKNLKVYAQTQGQDYGGCAMVARTFAGHVENCEFTLNVATAMLNHAAGGVLGVSVQGGSLENSKIHLWTQHMSTATDCFGYYGGRLEGDSFTAQNNQVIIPKGMEASFNAFVTNGVSGANYSDATMVEEAEEMNVSALNTNTEAAKHTGAVLDSTKSYCGLEVYKLEGTEWGDRYLDNTVNLWDDSTGKVAKKVTFFLSIDAAWSFDGGGAKQVWANDPNLDPWTRIEIDRIDSTQCRIYVSQYRARTYTFTKDTSFGKYCLNGALNIFGPDSGHTFYGTKMAIEWMTV